MGISRFEVAERLGMPPSKLSRMLGGRQHMTLRDLGAIAWALGFEVKDEDWLKYRKPRL